MLTQYICDFITNFVQDELGLCFIICTIYYFIFHLFIKKRIKPRLHKSDINQWIFLNGVNALTIAFSIMLYGLCNFLNLTISLFPVGLIIYIVQITFILLSDARFESNKISYNRASIIFSSKVIAMGTNAMILIKVSSVWDY